MPKSNALPIRPARSRAERSPDTWPVIWRVVAPLEGEYGRDVVFIETESEREARSQYHSLRCGDWPVRLERVHCGPLPANAEERLRAAPGFWTRASRKGAQA